MCNFSLCVWSVAVSLCGLFSLSISLCVWSVALCLDVSLYVFFCRRSRCLSLCVVYFSLSRCLCVWSCGSVLESEKTSLQQELSDVDSSLRATESARAEAQQRFQQLTRQLNSAQTERKSVVDRLQDVQAALTRADDAATQLRHENLALTQKVLLITLTTCSL